VEKKKQWPIWWHWGDNESGRRDELSYSEYILNRSPQFWEDHGDEKGIILS